MGKRIGPGGPPGLQIQSSGGGPIAGEFDSHTLPPMLNLMLSAIIIDFKTMHFGIHYFVRLKYLYFKIW